jgi:hypothetical protein
MAALPFSLAASDAAREAEALLPRVPELKAADASVAAAVPAAAVAASSCNFSAAAFGCGAKGTTLEVIDSSFELLSREREMEKSL